MTTTPADCDSGGGGQPPEIHTKRNVYQVDTLADKNTAADRPAVESEKKKKKRFKWTDHARRAVPSVDWLFMNYRWTEDLMEDTMAGITVAVLNIPQGMAYSILGNVEPTVGLYMAVFPVLVYSLLGTSRHISLGVLSVVCLMTGKVVIAHASSAVVPSDGDAVGLADPTATDGYTAIQVATAVTLVVGLVQLAMYACRLGLLCTVLSETLVSGFTSAVAVIVLTSQLKELLGVDTVRRRGTMHVPYTYYDFVDRFHTVNWVTTSVSACTITVLLVWGAYFKDRVNKKLCMPLPIELIVTILSTVLFQVTTIAKDYNMVQMGEIKSGLPSFEVPPLRLFPAVFVDACVIAVVAYSITMSLALLVSEKLKYPLDTNQELLAQGLGNVVGSFFSCLPCGGSPSRSASQQTVGGKTQMASIVSAAIIVVVLMWVGAVFEPLPRCVLSCIVVVALKGIILQVLDLPRIWRASRSDGILWLVTYTTVVLFDIDSGLLVGVLVSLLFVFVKGLLNEVHTLGRLPDTDLYMRLDLYGDAAEVPGVRVIRYVGSLNVINRYMFKRKVTDAIHAPSCLHDVVTSSVWVTAAENKDLASPRPQPRPQSPPQCVVLDMAALQYADAAGIKTMSELFESLASDGFVVYLAAVPDSSFQYLRSSCPRSVLYFPTVHDAVVFHECGRGNDDGTRPQPQSRPVQSQPQPQQPDVANGLPSKTTDGV